MRGLRALVVLCVALCASAASSVRKIKSNRDMEKALELSKRSGKFLVVDFYTDACGPCRMIAPAYKALAEEMRDAAIFAKVDTRYNGETASRYQIRSTPTFMFFVDGKAQPSFQFSGAGEQQLRHYAQLAQKEAQKVFVELSRDLLGRFYAKYDPEKSEEAVDKVFEKCAARAKSDKCEGSTAAELAKKLADKYGKGPRPEKKVPGQASKEESRAGPREGNGSKGSSRGSSRRNSAPKTAEPATGMTLADFSAEALRGELEKRGFLVMTEGEASALMTGGGGEDARASGIEGDDFDEEDDEDDEDEEMELPDEWLPPATLDHSEKVVIVGAGPAGLSAAVYAARAGLEPLVIAPPVGGQLQGKGVNVENYPGVLSQTGPELVADMQKHADLYGAKFLYGLVDDVDFDEHPFTISARNHTIRAQAVILSTGADAKWLNVAGEEQFRGGGVSSCATCDGYLFRNKPAVVIGGGDAAMEDALVLARTSSSVTILHRRDQFRASKILADRVLEHPKINIRWNTTVKAFDGEAPCNAPVVEETVRPVEPGDASCLKKVLVQSIHSGEEDVLQAAAAFVAIGHKPNTHIVKGELEVDAAGYVVTRPGTTATSVPGVFAAGDVADKLYRQAITSAGSGAQAALDAERWLSERGLGISDITEPAPAIRDEL